MWGLSLLAFIGLVIWGGVILLGILVIAYISTHPPRYRADSTPEAFGAKFEDVRFPSQDGVMLSGWFVPADNPRGAIMLCHGMNSHRGNMLGWAAPLWEAGFSLLLFDFRAFGQSEGDLSTAGYLEQGDLKGAVDYLKSRSDSDTLPIGVFGFSMGGATALLATANDERISACATLGAYATVEGAILQRCKRHFGRLARPASWGMKHLGKWLGWFYVEPRKIVPLATAPQIAPRPCLILHSTEDRIIATQDAHAVATAIGDSAELRYLPNSGHSHLDSQSQEVAQQTLTTFFLEALAKPISVP